VKTKISSKLDTKVDIKINKMNKQKQAQKLYLHDND